MGRCGQCLAKTGPAAGRGKGVVACGLLGDEQPPLHTTLTIAKPAFKRAGLPVQPAPARARGPFGRQCNGDQCCCPPTAPLTLEQFRRSVGYLSAEADCSTKCTVNDERPRPQRALVRLHHISAISTGTTAPACGRNAVLRRKQCSCSPAPLRRKSCSSPAPRRLVSGTSNAFEPFSVRRPRREKQHPRTNRFGKFSL